MENLEILTENGKYLLKREKLYLIYRIGYIHESMATPPLNLVSRDRVRTVVHPPIQCPENKTTTLVNLLSVYCRPDLMKSETWLIRKD